MKLEEMRGQTLDYTEVERVIKAWEKDHPDCSIIVCDPDNVKKREEFRHQRPTQDMAFINLSAAGGGQVKIHNAAVFPPVTHQETNETPTPQRRTTTDAS